MPCRSDWDEGQGYRDATKEIDRLTRLLCMTCEVADKHKVCLPTEVLGWWGDHQAKDKVRLAAEAEQARILKIKTKAINKLSPEERQVLGIR